MLSVFDEGIVRVYSPGSFPGLLAKQGRIIRVGKGGTSSADKSDWCQLKMSSDDWLFVLSAAEILLQVFEFFCKIARSVVGLPLYEGDTVCRRRRNVYFEGVSIAEESGHENVENNVTKTQIFAM